MPIHPTKAIIDDIRQGKMVIMLDDEDRENEGDIIMAACDVTPWHINFMLHHARGVICVPMSERHRQQLQLPMMVPDNRANFTTNFTVSIEAANGVTTGVSVTERAHTILAAANPKAKPTDLVSPGHVFPLAAKSGGLRERAGHTEASVTLTQLAGKGEVAVLCEILNADGSMARRDDLEIFAEKHQIKLGTIADLMTYTNQEKRETACNL